MKKFVCTVCGYVFEGEAAPEFCPICKAPAEKFKEQTAEKTWAATGKEKGTAAKLTALAAKQGTGGHAAFLLSHRKPPKK